MNFFRQIKRGQKHLTLVVLLVLVGGVIFYALPAKAAIRTWDNGGGDGLWSNCANWSSNACPGASDIATFDGTSSANATIDASFAGSVAGVDINSGYTGVITQQRSLAIGSSHFDQAAGTFNQGTYTFTITNGSFSQSGGIFNTSTGSNSIERNFTINGTAVFNSSSTKTWTFIGGSSDTTVFTFPGTFPSIVDLNKTSFGESLTVVSGAVIPVMADTAGNAGALTINSGATVHLANIAYVGGGLTINGTLYASSTIDIDNGNFTLGSTGIFEFDGTTMNIERNYTDSGGTFDETGVTVTFDGGSSDSTIFTFPGAFPGIVDLNKGSSGESFTVTSGTVISSMANMTGNSGILTINDGATVHLANTAYTGGNLNINGTLYASSTITIIAGSFTLGSTGIFEFDGTTMNIRRNYTDNGGTFDETGVTVTFDGASSDPSVFTYPGSFPGIIDINKTAFNTSFTVASGTTIPTVASMTGNVGALVINTGATLHLATTGFIGSDLTINGSLYASSTIDINTGNFSLGATGTFVFDGTTMNIERNYTDSGGTFDETGVTVTFDGASSNPSTFTYPGSFPGIVDLHKTAFNTSFTVANGAIISTVANMTGNVGALIINSGGTMHLSSTGFVGSDLTINGSLYASSTIDINSGSFTLGSTGVFEFDGTTLNVEQNYTDNGGTFDETGVTVVFDGSSGANGTFTYPGLFPGIFDLHKTASNAYLTIGSGTIVPTAANMTGNVGGLTINSSASLYLGNTGYTGDNLTINGTLYASSTISASTGNLTFGNGSTFVYAGSALTVGDSYTDSGGNITNINGATITFTENGNSDSPISCSGSVPFPMTVTKTHPNHADVTLGAGCNATTSTSISTTADIIVNGTLATNGNQLSPFSLTVGSAGKLRIYGNQTMTAPTLNAGSLVDYYGPSTYTTLSAGNSYSNVRFSSGTYNLTGSYSVSGNFSNTGATFNQTSGTVTLNGTNQTISGNNTFYNLTKSNAGGNTLTFPAGSTQTINGTLTLSGTNSGSRLTLQSSSPSTQWYISPEGTRSINHLALSDANNTSGTDVVCYDSVDCFDGGNNVNFAFTAPPPPTPKVQLQGGMRLLGGIRLR